MLHSLCPYRPGSHDPESEVSGPQPIVDSPESSSNMRRRRPRLLIGAAGLEDQQGCLDHIRELDKAIVAVADRRLPSLLHRSHLADGPAQGVRGELCRQIVKELPERGAAKLRKVLRR